MSFDARSRERLEALGRQLPKRLPPPAAKPLPSPTGAEKAGGDDLAAGGRHRLENERNPEQLFRELIKASPDGTVPPHLLDRLRQLEQGAAATDAADATLLSPPASAAPQPPRRGGSATPKRPARPARRVDVSDAYIAFDRLLLEDDAPP